MSQLLTASPTEIARYARGALNLADALEVTPVPLDQVELAAGLHPAEALWEAGDAMPPHMLAILKKLGRRVMGGLALSEKQIYLDFNLPSPRRRFVHGHELGHEVLPWQKQAYYADTDFTLDPQTRDAMEAEANIFSAELLFGLDRFTTQADDYAPGILAPLSLNGDFAVSAHSALRRYAETTSYTVALLVFGRHGSRPVFEDQCAQSASFAHRYGPITPLLTPSLSQHPAVMAIGRASAGNTIENGETMTLDTRRGSVAFRTEAFTNGRVSFVMLSRRSILGRPLTRLAA